ncbi:hypothetical protein [Mesorhizobium sp.]|jgi:hypothetical protein|uniref:hypothetical protein n=1 Tax=Mesorhizobium sp. TaxID=1871066 RepID=UPI00356213E0
MSSSKIYAVDDIETTLLKSNPPSLLIICLGRVTTSGWSNGELSQYVYLTPPADGIQEFDFTATRPVAGSIVLPVLRPIRAEAVLDGIDLANYWGPGLPLRGVRVFAVSNSKTVSFDATSKMHNLATGQGVAAGPSRTMDAMPAPSFETDIKPLFRKKDINAMKAVAGWRLDVYEDVKANIEGIGGEIRAGSMPCDGPWPQSDIDLFDKWIKGGMQA